MTVQVSGWPLFQRMHVIDGTPVCRCTGFRAHVRNAGLAPMLKTLSLLLGLARSLAHTTYAHGGSFRLCRLLRSSGHLPGPATKRFKPAAPPEPHS